MVKVSIAVRSGAATFGVAVQARSAERALSLVQRRYPEGKARAGSEPARMKSEEERGEIAA